MKKFFSLLLAALLLIAPISTAQADDDKTVHAYILTCGVTVYDEPEILIDFEIDIELGDDYFLAMWEFYEWYFCEHLGLGRQ